MNARVYVVPGLACVTVDADVIDLVRSAIDFQLAHFALLEEGAAPQALPLISIKPYAHYGGPTGRVRFHGAFAEIGSMFNEPKARYVVQRNQGGFSVFTDTPEVLIVVLLQAIALTQGRTFVHAAGWCDAKGRATLVPGPGGVGKTALLSAAVLRHGATLLGDDLVLVGPGGADAFPRAFVLKDYHRTIFPNAFAAAATERRRLNQWRPVVKFVRENAPFHGVLKSIFRRSGRLESASSWLQARAVAPEFHTVPVSRLFGADKIASSGVVRRVIWLERHSGDGFRFETLQREAAVRRSLAVLHHEWADFLRWFCGLASVDVIDFGAHVQATQAALSGAFSGAEIRIMQVPDRASPDELEHAFATLAGFEAT